MKLTKEFPGCMASEKFESALRVLHVARTEQHDQEVEAVHQDCAVQCASGDGLPFHMSSGGRRGGRDELSNTDWQADLLPMETPTGGSEELTDFSIPSRAIQRFSRSQISVAPSASTSIRSIKGQLKAKKRRYHENPAADGSVNSSLDGSALASVHSKLQQFDISIGFTEVHDHLSGPVFAPIIDHNNLEEITNSAGGLFFPPHLVRDLLPLCPILQEFNGFVEHDRQALLLVVSRNDQCEVTGGRTEDLLGELGLLLLPNIKLICFGSKAVPLRGNDSRVEYPP
jgi:hypothetical protein